MNKFFMVLLCAAGFCCAQLMPSANSASTATASNASAPAASANASAPADSIKTLKVKAPVNYDMLIYNSGDSRDGEASPRVKNQPSRSTGNALVSTAKFVGTLGMFIAAGVLSDGPVYWDENNEAVNTSANLKKETEFFSEGKENALREKSLK